MQNKQIKSRINVSNIFHVYIRCTVYVVHSHFFKAWGLCWQIAVAAVQCCSQRNHILRQTLQQAQLYFQITKLAFTFILLSVDRWILHSFNGLCEIDTIYSYIQVLCCTFIHVFVSVVRLCCHTLQIISLLPHNDDLLHALTHGLN